MGKKISQMKKVLSLFLCFTMIFTALPMELLAGGLPSENALEAPVEEASTALKGGISGKVQLGEDPAGLANYEVKLYGGDHEVESKQTDGNGRYAFNELLEGAYSVEAVKTEGVVDKVKLSPVLVEEGSIIENQDIKLEPLPEELPAEPEEESKVAEEPLLAVAVSPTEETVEDTKAISTGIVKGFVWLDTEEDGIYDVNKLLIPDFPVSLYKAGDSDTAVQTAVTDSAGKYIFEAVETGDYVLKIQATTGTDKRYMPSIDGLKKDNAFAINPEDGSATTTVFAVKDLETVDNLNAGLHLMPEISQSTIGVNSVTVTPNSIRVTGSFNFDYGYPAINATFVQVAPPGTTSNAGSSSSQITVTQDPAQATWKQLEGRASTHTTGVRSGSYDGTVGGLTPNTNYIYRTILTTDLSFFRYHEISQTAAFKTPYYTTVNFDAKYGGNPSARIYDSNQTFNAVGGTLPTPTARPGYTFNGWWTAASGGTRVTDGHNVGTIFPNSAPNHLNVTLHAQWSLNNNTVAFDAQGGTAATPASKVVQSNQAIGALATTTRAGYSFAGWWTAPSGGVQASTASTPIGLNGSLGANATITLYARWTLNNNTVAFDTQGGAPGAASITRQSTQAIGALPTVARAGYTFAGWWTAPSGGAQASAASTPIGLNGSLGANGTITLYARWTLNNNTVAFDTQGGSPGVASMARQSNQAIGTLPIVSKANYVLSGWYTAANGGGTQASAASTPIGLNGSLADNATLTLYAKWSPVQYPVQVNYETRSGGSVTGASDFSVNKDFGSTYEPTAAEKAVNNYILVNWLLDGVSQNNTTPSVTVPSNGCTITLVYGQDLNNNGVEDVSFTIKHATAGGTAIGTDRIATVDIGDSFNESADLITGYTYNNTYIDQDGNPQTNTPNFIVALSDAGKTITYEYTINSHLVNVYVIDRDGNSIDSGAHDILNVSKEFAEIYTAATPSITDYVFADWKDGIGGALKGNINPTITIPDNDVDIYLVYGQDLNNNGVEDVTFTVKHATVGGSAIGTDRDITLDIGETFNESADAILGYGYNNTYIYASNPAQGGTPNFIVGLSDRNQTLTYEYLANTHTINVYVIDRDGNGVAGGVYDAIGISKDFAESFTATSPAITNYVFADWKTGTIGLQGNTNPTIIMPDADVDIYLIYGQDLDNNGVEDVNITIKHQTVAGVAIGTDRVVTKNIGETFNEVAATITGHTYNNTYIDQGSNSQNGTPNFTVALGDRNAALIYEYTVNSYIVEVQHELRDGSSVPGSTDFQVSKLFGATYAPNVSVTDYILVDWLLDGVSQGNTTPSITVSDDTLITLLYGQDFNNDGIEDFVVTVKHETVSGGILKADERILVDINDTFTGNPDINLTTISHSFVEYVWDADPASTTLPVTVANITDNHTLIFKYTPNEYPVNVTYEYEANDGTISSLPGSESDLIIHGDAFTPIVPSFTQKTLIGWTLDGVAQNGTPTVVSVERFHDIVLIYGQDMDGDGVRDYTITETCNCNISGNQLYNRIIYVPVNTNYSVNPQSFNHHKYAGFSVDGGAMQAASNPKNPQIANVNADHNVKILYGHADYTIQVNVVDTNGNAIGSNSYRVNRAYQESFSAPVPMLQGYDFVKWQLNGGDQSGSNPAISSVDGNAIVTLIYQAIASTSESGDTGYENYEFIKRPNVKNVDPGEMVNYTFAGFGNKYPVDLEKYQIVDQPDRGLDFVGATIPAFKNGAGVTYSVKYKTNLSGTRVLYEKIPADKGFSVKAPALSNGEYITGISIEFGTVPSGFAVGDTMEMTFRVWDNPPAEVLSNVGILLYRVYGKDMQFVTGGIDTSVTINGWFSGPGTGDRNAVEGYVRLATGAAMGLVLIGIMRRRRHNTIIQG